MIDKKCFTTEWIAQKSIELIERKQAGKDVPKDHSKFFYKVAFNADLKHFNMIIVSILR